MATKILQRYSMQSIESRDQVSSDSLHVQSGESFLSITKLTNIRLYYNKISKLECISSLIIIISKEKLDSVHAYKLTNVIYH